jgi:GT2 family glycosyltransferase
MALVSHLDCLGKMGIAWPKVLNPDGTLQIGVTRFPRDFVEVIRGTQVRNLFAGWTDESINGSGVPMLPERIEEVENFSGCGFLIKAEYVRHHGLYDEETFLYGEEHILSWRIHRFGYRIYVVPQARIVHKGDCSGQRLGAARKWVEAIRSELRYCRACLGLRWYHIGILKLARTAGFLWKSARSTEYRQIAPYFARNYILK